MCLHILKDIKSPLFISFKMCSHIFSLSQIWPFYDLVFLKSFPRVETILVLKFLLLYFFLVRFNADYCRGGVEADVNRQLGLGGGRTLRHNTAASAADSHRINSDFWSLFLLYFFCIPP